MDTLHGARAGPGAQGGDRGSFGGQASTPDRTPAEDSAFSYANPLSEDSPTISSAGLTDIPDTGRQSASCEMPGPLPGSTDTGWYEVDGIRGRVVIVRAPDGGRLGRLIQDLLLDCDDGLAAATVPIPALSPLGDDAVAVNIPDDGEQVLV